MARCGCNNTCSCTIVSGTGTTVQGIGSADQPYKINWAPDLGNGLAATRDGVLSVKLSQDGNNGLSFDADGGLFGGGEGGGGGTPAGDVTVDGLPTARQVVAGRWGAGPHLAPYSTVQSLEQAVSLRLDATSVRVWILADGTPVIAPLPKIRSWTTNWEPTGADQDESPKNLNRMQWARLYSNVGSNMAANNDRDTWFNPREPTDGWFQFNFPDFHGGQTMQDVLAAVGRKIVLIAEIQDDDAIGPLMSIVSRYGAQKSVIVVGSSLEPLAPVTDANIATGVYVADPKVITPQQIVDANVGWVLVDRDMADADVTSYVQAGLNVLITRQTRHSDAARAARLGVRGGLCNDPIYYAGGLATPDTRYRFRKSTFLYKTPMYGMVSYLQDGLAGEEHFLNGRGYVRNDYTGGSGDYWMLTPTIPDSAKDDQFYALLLGFLHGVNPSGSLNLEYWACWGNGDTSNELPNNTASQMGVIVGVPDDANIRQVGDIRGFLCGFRATGAMFIWKFPGASATWDEIASGSSPAPKVNIHTKFTVTLDGNGISFTRTVGDQDYKISSSDTTYGPDGAYTWIYRNTQGQNSYPVAFGAMTVAEPT